MHHRPAVVAVAVALLVPAGSGAQQGSEKLYFPACPEPSAEMTFDCYHSYQEVGAFLRWAADAHPGRARLASMGRSFQGRELWVLTITDYSTGEPSAKPALWVDGGIDADEVVAIEAALGVVHRLVTSDEARIRELLRTRTVYVAPAVIPDASELHHTTPIRPHDTTLRPWDDDGDGRIDEDGPDDLDGDDEALRMRIQDPTGDWVKAEEDGRLMRRRRAGDAGPFYRVLGEGVDDDGDGSYGEDPAGGIDPNRNYPGNWSAGQGGSGPYAASEVELRAMLDFLTAHPNVAASQHFHSSGGVVLHPPSVPDMELPDPDLDLYLELSRLGLEVTGYDLATSVYDWNWPRGSSNRKRGQVWRDADGRLHSSRLGIPDDAYGEPGGSARAGVAWPARPLASDRGDPRGSSYPAYGGSIDGLYLLFGVLSFANEIYAMGEDYDGDGRIEPAEQLRYSDREMDGYAFKEWTAFQHPELGPVEIGGWRKFGHNNPPPDELPEEVRRNVEFALVQAEQLPRLTLPGVEVEALDGGVHRVSVSVRNSGYQPTELAWTESRGGAVPVRVRIEGAGVEVLGPDEGLDLGVFPGHHQEEIRWIVRGEAGAGFTVRAWHPRAGVVRARGRLP